MEKQLDLKPKISVIIPSHNRHLVLRDVLHGLEKQDCSKYSYEVIVVDDGSTDETAEFLHRFSRQTTMNFRPVIGKCGSASASRNLGINRAKGDYILFLDADTIPEETLVLRHLQHQNHFGDAKVCILGQVSMAPELDQPDQARLWETEFNFEQADLVELEWWKYRTANTSIKKSLLKQLGGFNNKLLAAEDTELAYRLSQTDVRFYYDESIVAIHYHPIDLDNYLQKASVYGQAVGRWYQMNPELRRDLVMRYGVFAVELPLESKVKYFIRSLIVNRATLPVIVFLGKLVRRYWFIASDALYKCAYKYRIRRAFRQSMAAATK